VLAIEKATAELTASFVLAGLGIAHHLRRDRAAHIASWLEVLKGDAHAIVTAASKAQRAADWMHAQQPNVARAEPRNRLASAVLRGAPSRQDCGGADPADRGDRCP